jgi:hypothetical protein
MGDGSSPDCILSPITTQALTSLLSLSTVKLLIFMRGHSERQREDLSACSNRSCFPGLASLKCLFCKEPKPVT